MKFFSLNKLLHNRKAMIVFSLLASIVIWASVVTGPGYTKNITVSFTVDLSGSYQGNTGLRVIGDNTFETTVTVNGPFSVVTKLDADDLRVTADVSEIKGVGNNEISLSVGRNSAETGYKIVSLFPETVTVYCDYWVDNRRFEVKANLGNLKAEPENSILGEAQFDTRVLPNGLVSLEGPKGDIDKIRSIEARIPDDQAGAISAKKTFTANLVALDEKGAEVDTSRCKFKELPNKTVNMTVPILFYHTVEFNLPKLHIPPGLEKDENFVTVVPPQITLLGEREVLDTYADDIAQLDPIDFDTLTEKDSLLTRPLEIPPTLKVLEDINTVDIEINTRGFVSKTITLDFTNKQHLQVLHYINVPDGLKPEMLTKRLAVTIVGPGSTVRDLTYKDLSITIDCRTAQRGPNSFTVRPVVTGRDNVWLYYPEGGGYEVSTVLS